MAREVITITDSVNSTVISITGERGPQGIQGATGVVAATAPATYDSGTQTVGVTVGTTANTLAAGDDGRITGAAQKASNLTDLTDAAAARIALGLGSAATAATSAFDPAGAASTAQSAAQSYAAALVDDLSGVSDAVAARAALGLGTMATESASQYAKLSTANAFTIGQSIATSSANQVGLTVKGSVSQAWNLVNYTDSTGASVGGVLAGGQLNIPNGSLGTLGFGFRGNGSYDYGFYGYSGGFIAAAAGTNLMTFTSTGPKFAAAIRPSGDDPAMVGLPIKLVAAQTAAGLEVKSSADALLASISANGTGTFAGVSCGSFVNGATSPYLHLNSNRNGVGVINRNVITQIPFHVQGMAGQTGNLTNWLDGSAVTLASVTAAGLHRWDAAANQQTTVGAAGGASALPATPTKYLKVVDSTGATLVIPAYAAA